MSKNNISSKNKLLMDQLFPPNHKKGRVVTQGVLTTKVPELESEEKDCISLSDKSDQNKSKSVEVVAEDSNDLSKYPKNQYLQSVSPSQEELLQKQIQQELGLAQPKQEDALMNLEITNSNSQDEDKDEERDSYYDPKDTTSQKDDKKDKASKATMLFGTKKLVNRTANHFGNVINPLNGSKIIATLPPEVLSNRHNSLLKAMRMQNLISFFVDQGEVPEEEQQHIYAHLEFTTDESGKRKTRIKKREEIMQILKDESVLLRQYMFNSYNIRLEVDKEGGFINSFPFKQRWLRGEEYGFLCRHYYAYSNFVKMRDFRAPFPVKHQNHPEEIYNNPNCKCQNNSNFCCRRRFLLYQKLALAVLRISQADARARERAYP